MTPVLLLLAQLSAPIPDVADKYIAPLVTCAQAEGWEVEFDALPDGVFVAGNRVELRMVVNESLDSAGRVGALLYQLAYIHRPPHLNKSDQELLSELVANILLVQWKLPTDASDEYLAQFGKKDILVKAEGEYIGQLSAMIHTCATKGPEAARHD